MPYWCTGGPPSEKPNNVLLLWVTRANTNSVDATVRIILVPSTQACCATTPPSLSVTYISQRNSIEVYNGIMQYDMM